MKKSPAWRLLFCGHAGANHGGGPMEISEREGTENAFRTCRLLDFSFGYWGSHSAEMLSFWLVDLFFCFFYGVNGRL